MLTWENIREEDLNFVDVFSPFHNYLPLENGVIPPLNKLEFSSPKDALPKVWMKFAQWLWRFFFLKIVNVLSLFYYYLPLEEDGAIYLVKVSLIHPRMLCTKFGWKWPCGSGVIFKKIISAKSAISLLFKGALCQFWLKLNQGFWRRNCFKISLKYFHYFVIKRARFVKIIPVVLKKMGFY